MAAQHSILCPVCYREFRNKTKLLHHLKCAYGHDKSQEMSDLLERNKPKRARKLVSVKKCKLLWYAFDPCSHFCREVMPDGSYCRVFFGFGTYANQNRMSHYQNHLANGFWRYVCLDCKKEFKQTSNAKIHSLGYCHDTGNVEAVSKGIYDRFERCINYLDGKALSKQAKEEDSKENGDRYEHMYGSFPPPNGPRLPREPKDYDEDFLNAWYNQNQGNRDIEACRLNIKEDPSYPTWRHTDGLGENANGMLIDGLSNQTLMKQDSLGQTREEHSALNVCEFFESNASDTQSVDFVNNQTQVSHTQVNELDEDSLEIVDYNQWQQQQRMAEANSNQSAPCLDMNTSCTTTSVDTMSIRRLKSKIRMALAGVVTDRPIQLDPDYVPDIVRSLREKIDTFNRMTTTFEGDDDEDVKLSLLEDAVIKLNAYLWKLLNYSGRVKQFNSTLNQPNFECIKMEDDK